MRFFRRKPKPAPAYRRCDVDTCDKYAYRAYSNGDSYVYRCMAHPLERGVLTGAVDVVEVTSFSPPFSMPIPEKGLPLR